jgi:hypothetical protein
MKILLENKLIETRDIADIVDIEAGKKMFLNREAGFRIIFLDGSELIFKENISYESYPREINQKKEKWEKLMNKVKEEFINDRTEIKSFKLNQ